MKTAPSDGLTLDASLAKEVRRLSQPSVLRALGDYAFDWAIIAASIAISMQLQHWFSTLLALVLIACRQQGLLVLMHDAAHYRLFRSRKASEWVSNWFGAYLFGVTTDGYRQGHLLHHRAPNTDRDPDWVFRKAMPEWQYPKTKQDLIWTAIRFVLGGGLLFLVKGIQFYSKLPANQGRSFQATWPLDRILFYASLFTGLSYWGWWDEALLYWFVPSWILLPTITRARSIAEHFGLPSEHTLNSSRNYFPSALERFFLFPHNVYLHLDHHLFPAVPSYRLPALHQILLSVPKYAERAYQNNAVFSRKSGSVLKDLLIPEGAT